jgi:hypothetical protein
MKYSLDMDRDVVKYKDFDDSFKYINNIEFIMSTNRGAIMLVLAK